MTYDAAPPVPRRPAAPAFPVVVLAASAGGIEALGQIFGALPVDFPAALAVVQHRYPHVPGFLAAVLQRSSTLPVQDAATGDRLQPGHIHLAPANRHLVVEPDGSLSLSAAARVRWTRPAADVLFASVAPVFTTRVIAVILTGYDSDGTNGLQVVKQWGGTVLAQDEASSQVFQMPRSAIATGDVDEVLSPPGDRPGLTSPRDAADSRRAVRPAQRSLVGNALLTPLHTGACDPHMPEPDIPPLFQTIPKAESPRSFLKTKHPPGSFPIRVIISTTQ